MAHDRIQDAATIIVVRDLEANPRILMGQRGQSAAFMPNKFVFPGGAVDETDQQVVLTDDILPPCADRLQDQSNVSAKALAAAGIRELWEESGLILGQPGVWSEPPKGWRRFAAMGYLPSAAPLRFVFRAITPPGRPRRFDARFFLLDARHLMGDLDDFSRACDELSHLQWVPLQAARDYDLPFITEVVLAEVSARLPNLDPPATVPFFKNDDEESLFLRLRG
ncbi:NUDIX hydrolase [Pseudaestuariivita rosea]|uniref:NUDIX hydrolase n=1 Tax=Pseudaestuariivita rosea TaxID=2763263 RepID=UPI001ABAF1EF|nr:NUDIX hydrolase [Pseudaestuariivita rosea]